MSEMKKLDEHQLDMIAGGAGANRVQYQIVEKKSGRVVGIYSEKEEALEDMINYSDIDYEVREVSLP